MSVNLLVQHRVSIFLGEALPEDLSIGLFGDFLRWSDTPYDVDETEVPALLSTEDLGVVAWSAQIAEGGNLGGFDEWSFVVRHPDLVAAMPSLPLIGSTLVLYCFTGGFGGTHHRSVIKSVSYEGDGSVRITTASSTELFDETAGQQTLVAPEYLLHPSNRATPESYPEVFGGATYFPTYRAWQPGTIAALAQPSFEEGGVKVIFADAANPLGIPQVQDRDGVPKGVTLLHAHYARIPAGQPFVYLHLTVNGQAMLQGTGTDDQLARNRRIFAGTQLEVVRGTGSGAIYDVLDVVADSYGQSRFALKISCKDLSQITFAQEYSDPPSFSAPGAGPLLVPTLLSSLTGGGDYLTLDGAWARYEPGFAVQSDLSTFVIKSPVGLRMVAAKAVLTNRAYMQVVDSEGAVTEVIASLDKPTTSGLSPAEESTLVPLRINTTLGKTGGLAYSAAEDARWWEVDASQPEKLNSWAWDGQVGGPSSFYPAIAHMGPLWSDGTIYIWNRTLDVDAEYVAFSTARFIPLEKDDRSLLTREGSLAIWPMMGLEVITAGSGIKRTTLRSIFTAYVIGESGHVLATKEVTLASFYEVQGGDTISYGAYENATIKGTTPSTKGLSLEAQSTQLRTELALEEELFAHSQQHVRGVLLVCRMGHTAIEKFGVGAILRVGVGTPQVGKSVDLEGGSVWVKAAGVSRPFAPEGCTCPADLVAQITRQELGYNTPGGVSVRDAQRARMDAPFSYSGQVRRAPGESISSLLARVARGSGMLITPYFFEDSGSVRLRFVDLHGPIGTPVALDGDDIAQDSFSVSAPFGGYRYSDYDFSVRKVPWGDGETLSIHPREEDPFPSEGDETPYALSEASSSTVEYLSVSSRQLNLRVRGWYQGSRMTSALTAVQGQRIRVTALSDTSEPRYWTGVLSRVAPPVAVPHSSGEPEVTLMIKLDEGFVDISSESGFLVIAPEVLIPLPDWRRRVSGSYLKEYLFGKQIYDLALDAFRTTGSALTMPSDATTLSDPIWGEDERGLSQWVTGQILWGSREKRVIRFKTTSFIELGSPVSVAFGPYADSPAVGYAVEVSYDPSAALRSVTVLTAPAEDAVILDETTELFDLVVDETDASGTTTYDEGTL